MFKIDVRVSATVALSSATTSEIYFVNRKGAPTRSRSVTLEGLILRSKTKAMEATGVAWPSRLSAMGPSGRPDISFHFLDLGHLQ